MNLYLKEGWKAALHQPFAIIFLFIYQLIWGMLLYKLVQSIVIPLMYRYPDETQHQSAVQLFLAESQFQLFKTDIAYSYIGWLAALLAARMLLTPLLNAGVYYSITHTELHAGYRFVKGIKVLFLSFFLIYLIQLVLTLSPLLWLLPKAKELLAGAHSYESVLGQLAPWFIGFLVYGYMIRLCFMYIQFARAGNASLSSSLGVFLKNFLRVSSLAVVPLAVSGFSTASLVTLSYIWAGLLALLVYQLYPLIGLIFQVWSITSQHQLWSAKIHK